MLYLWSYFAGALTVGVAVYEAQGRPALAMFTLGVASTLMLLASLLRVKWIRRRLATRLTPRPPARPRPTPRPRPTLPPAAAVPPPAPPPELPDDEEDGELLTVRAEVASALKNFGLTRKKAAAAAEAASKETGADFAAMFRRALEYAR